MKNLSIEKSMVWVGIIAFWAVMALTCTGAFAQSWVNVGNGLQQKVVGVDTSYRFIKTPGNGLPFGITEQLNERQTKFLVNVKDYGAKGDGVTNDYTAIMAAHDALPAVGGTIFFPSGQYLTSGGLIFTKPGLRIEGENGSYTYDYNLLESQKVGSIILNNSSTTTLLQINTPGSAVENITLLNTSSTAPTAGFNLNLINAGFFSLNNSSFVGAYKNVNVEDGAFWTIDRCRFINPVVYNLVLNNADNPDSGDNAISNSSFGTNSLGLVTNLKLESGGGLRIVNCKFNPAYGGIALTHVDATASGSSQLLISSTSFEGYTGYAVRVHPTIAKDFSGITISSNYFRSFSNTAAFISIEGCDIGNITGNIFQGDNLQTNPVINLSNSSMYTILSNSYINCLPPFIGTETSIDNSILIDPPTSLGEMSTIGVSAQALDATKWNGTSFDAGEIAAPTNFLTFGSSGTSAGYTSLAQVKAILKLSGILEYADNAAAIAGGLAVGDFYRTGDILKVVH